MQRGVLASLANTEDYGGQMNSFAKLLSYRELLYLITWRDIRVRYKQSVMGIMWAVLMPILIVGSGVVIRFGLAEYTDQSVGKQELLSVVVRAVVWAFFVSAVRFGTNSLVANPSLVSKVAFPKEIFPLGAVLSSLFDFCVAAVIAILTVLVVGGGLTVHALLAPALLVLVVAMTLGLVLIMSSLNLFFRDVKYLVEIILTYAIFFTPVLYSADMVGKWKSLLMWNPMSPLLEGISDVMVYGRLPSLSWVSYSAAVSLVLVLFGYWLFKQLETKFAERI